MDNSDPESPDLYERAENINQPGIKILWSGFYFALSYLLVSYSGYLVQALNASVIGYDVIFSYEGVSISGGTSPWTAKRIAFVFLAPPLHGMLISWIGFALCHTFTFKYSHLRIFFFWLSINGFALFYSYFFTGILAFGNFYTKYFTGFAAFFAWLYLGKGTITFLLLTFTALFTIYPLLFGWLTLSFSHSSELMERKQGRKIIFLNVLVFPFITGIILVFITTYPLDKAFQVVRWLVYPIVFSIIYSWFLSIKHATAIVKKGGIENRSPWLLLLLMVIIILAGRFLLPVKIVL